ncbi:hypothetical protein NKH18_02220 [Streptomyces sp. M10(2022)]
MDDDWALTLAELETESPPILVHHPTLTVIDGLHRLRAARLRGASTSPSVSSTAPRRTRLCWPWR